MMLILIAAAVGQVIYGDLKPIEVPIPYNQSIDEKLEAPESPSPFTAKVQALSRKLGEQVAKQHDRCDAPFGKATARYVEAMGSPAHSPEWEKAKAAQHEMIEACQNYRSALRAQSDFMQKVVANGSRYDAKLARAALSSLTFVVKGWEDQLLEATLDYEELVLFGRGRNKDGSDPNGK